MTNRVADCVGAGLLAEAYILSGRTEDARVLLTTLRGRGYAERFLWDLATDNGIVPAASHPD